MFDSLSVREICRLCPGTGLIELLKSPIHQEVLIKVLAELGAAWEKLGTLEGHKEWGKGIEPYIVSGTPHWQIFRVI
jgi:hypothetical protein